MMEYRVSANVYCTELLNIVWLYSLFKNLGALAVCKYGSCPFL